MCYCIFFFSSDLVIVIYVTLYLLVDLLSESFLHIEKSCLRKDYACNNVKNVAFDGIAPSDL